ncbi:hypothetical protein BU15DRAFT_54716 [Melanogaster broomeanus]|nr:hypothetical protein BU15DRAFT_54716 [Melanogaster broomeanus]
MFKASVPTTDGRVPLTLIFPIPVSLPIPPAGRATRAFPAYDVRGERIVYFKDSWRVSSTGITPEGETYAKLNQNSVPNIPTCLACGDVDCWPEQEPKTSEYSTSTWACRQGMKITPHIHYRLVLDIVGVRLTNFSSSRELVRAVHDAIIAHQCAWVLGILHRDISVGNIIIFLLQGYLIDWDLAKSVDIDVPRRITRTGTWQFMSAHLVEDSAALHTFVDDMESAFWVLLWTCLMFSKSTLSTERRSIFIRDNFDVTAMGNCGGQGKGNFLRSQRTLTPELFPGRSSLYDLL